MFQFNSPEWSAFNSRFTKFVLGTSGVIKFVNLVEDSDTDSPSLITVRLEYLLCNSHVVNLVWESSEEEVASIIVNFCYLGVLWSSVGESWWGGAESFCESVQDCFTYNPSGGKILVRDSAGYNKLLRRVTFRILPRWSSPVKTTKSLKTWTVYTKKHSRRR